QPPGIDTDQDALRLLDDGFEPADQLLFRDRPGFGKLGRTIPYVRRTAETGHDPLPHVATQMQDQVADAVEARPGLQPHLLVVQLAEAVSDGPAIRHSMGPVVWPALPTPGGRAPCAGSVWRVRHPQFGQQFAILPQARAGPQPLQPRLLLFIGPDHP